MSETWDDVCYRLRKEFLRALDLGQTTLETHQYDKFYYKMLEEYTSEIRQSAPHRSLVEIVDFLVKG